MSELRTLMGKKRRVVAFEEIAECPKCGGVDLWRTYHENMHSPCDLRGFTSECCTFEHHCRGCRGCRYEWVEMTKDAPAPKAGAIQEGGERV